MNVKTWEWAWVCVHVDNSLAVPAWKLEDGWMVLGLDPKERPEVVFVKAPLKRPVGL